MDRLSNVNVPRNALMFGEALEKKGLTYADVYYRLNTNGITEFNEILTKSGALVQGENGRYTGSRSFYAADSGLRTPEEVSLDCAVGNIQEALFCIDNIDFMRNPKATNVKTTNDYDITTKVLDLIHRPTGEPVEFKVSYSGLYGRNNDYAFYNHRGADFEQFMEEGKIMIIYFIDIDKVAVVSKKFFGKSVKIKEHDVIKFNKHWDSVTVSKFAMDDYSMMKNGNHRLSEQISRRVKYGK